MTDDRQTDHATEKCVGIGGIACAVSLIPPNNNNNAPSQVEQACIHSSLPGFYRPENVPHLPAAWHKEIAEHLHAHHGQNTKQSVRANLVNPQTSQIDHLFLNEN